MPLKAALSSDGTSRVTGFSEEGLNACVETDAQHFLCSHMIVHDWQVMLSKGIGLHEHQLWTAPNNPAHSCSELLL